MIIKVKPIEEVKWHGKTGNESFARPKTIQALVSASTMQYACGLTEKEIEEYSKKLKIDLSPQFVLGTIHPFYDSKIGQIKLENKTMFFDKRNPLDYVKIAILKASSSVANSMKEYEEGLFPEATHVIFDTQEEVELKATQIEIQNKIIIETAKLSKEKKTEMIMILGGVNVKGKSDNFIAVELDKLIKTKAEEILVFLNRDKEETSLHALILEALQRNVLHKEGHKIMYMESVVGQDIYEVIEYLKLPENQDFKLRIISLLNK